MRWIRAALAVTVVALSCACSPGVVGTPVAELWDPCTIPSEAIAAAGVDPQVVSDEYLGLDQEDWNLCLFRQDWYFFSIQSTRHTYQELLDNALMTGFTDAFVGDRKAVTYHRFNDTSGDDCSLGLEYAQGLIVLNVNNSGIEVRQAEMCPLVQQIADALEYDLPK